MTTDCKICGGNILDTTYERILRCGHKFHVGCFYANNKKCPLCNDIDHLTGKLTNLCM
jgi:hypothetical protein